MRDFKLLQYHKYISELVKQFEEVQFEHMLRKENQIIDALATLAAMIKIDATTKIQPIKLDVNDEPAHYLGVEEEVDREPWLAMSFFLDRDVFYKRGRDQVLLRCVNVVEVKRIIGEVNDGIYADKIQAHLIALHVLAPLWPFSMKMDTKLRGPIRGEKAISNRVFNFGRDGRK
ncbi:uncharacterized protein LOC111307043 [Durio zibethinus]|uniref:Uncharacterized protein LOC111307043 n=1 Tax=Durio zibethinus TaxID=66656 RepID=A0A6P6A7D7_DURZI|nr:uncharacterized protein LOC111307043 [Durio zibethinus]